MVQPRNYLLFACHATNATAQSVNDFRFYKYWYMGGREKKLEEKALTEAKHGSVTEAVKAHLEAKSKP
jgi:mitochondrial pyruvate carrier 1